MATAWMMTRKNKAEKTVYAVQWREPKTNITKTETIGTDQALAREKLAERRRELREGRYHLTQRITMADFTRKHIESLTGTLTEGSINLHERTLRQFQEACSPRWVSDIDAAMILQFRSNRIEAGWSEATVNLAMRTMQGILARAEMLGYLRENPFTAFKGGRQRFFLKEAEPEPKYISDTEFAQIERACLDAMWKGICVVGYFCGMRQSEIINLEWLDVDFERGLIHVRNTGDKRTKSRRDRSINMADRVRSALKAVQAAQAEMLNDKMKDKEGKPIRVRHVFTNHKLQWKPYRNNINRNFAATVRRAKLVDSNGEPLYTMHDLRRSFVTNALRSGVDPKTVQKLAGHSDITTTMKFYAGVTDEHSAEAIRRMERYLARA